MVFIIGLTIKGVKYAHKTYKKHQAEKDLRERGIPHTISDPSDEILDTSNDHSNDGVYANGRSPSTSPRDLKRALQQRNSSSSSINSVSTAEVEAQLENDVEFQEYMRQQRLAYVNQRRATTTTGRSYNNAVSSDDGLMVQSVEVEEEQHPMSPSSLAPPPAYELVVSQDNSNNNNRLPAHIVSSRSLQQRLVELSTDEETYVVSPMTPLSNRTRSRVSRLNDASVSSRGTAPISPVGIVSELPAAPHASTSRFPVELPAKSL